MSKDKQKYYLQVGDSVGVIKFIGKEFEDNDDKIGEIYHRNGEYIYVRLNKSKVEIECYPCELEQLKEEWVYITNYS